MSIRTIEENKKKKIKKFYELFKNDKKINLWWWSETNLVNFGDELSPFIISRLFDVEIHNFRKYDLYFTMKQRITNKFLRVAKKTGINLFWNPPIYMSIGSIIQFSNNNTIIWGSGIISKNDKIKCKSIKAVRGYKTLERLKQLNIKESKIEIGDPALLLPLIFTPKEIIKKHKLGIIPHYTDFSYIKQLKLNDEILIINLETSNIELIVEQINSCERTISSSLHGIIVSQAYNVPSLWFKFSNNLSGDDIKFADYFSSVEINEYNAFQVLHDNLNLENIEKVFRENLAKSKIQINIEGLQKNLLLAAPFNLKKQFRHFLRS